MPQDTKKLFSRFCVFTFLWGLKMCVIQTDLWGPFKSPHYDGLFSYYNVFMRTFLWGLENVPTIWTDPTLLVCIHMNVPIGVQRCTHTRTHTWSAKIVIFRITLPTALLLRFKSAFHFIFISTSSLNIWILHRTKQRIICHPVLFKADFFGPFFSSKQVFDRAGLLFQL